MDTRTHGAPLLAACGLAFEAAIAAGPGVVAVRGPGPQRLSAGLDALAAAGSLAFAGILSFGCAGGLDPELAPGTVVLATGVHTAEEYLGADPAWLEALMRLFPDAAAGELIGLDAPLPAAFDKRALWRSAGARIADMESHAAALAARRHGLPFAACRVVLDPAWRDVPPCALAGLRADGGTAFAPLLRALSAPPGVVRQLGPLCELARDAWTARRALRRVRTKLGPRLALPA